MGWVVPLDVFIYATREMIDSALHIFIKMKSRKKRREAKTKLKGAGDAAAALRKM